MRLLTLLAVIALASCGNGGSGNTNGDLQKITGPNLKSLSHDQLMDVLHECHRYGTSDDPRVKYTVAYCSSAQSAHAMEGYATPSAAAVDPSINQLH